MATTIDDGMEEVMVTDAHSSHAILVDEIARLRRTNAKLLAACKAVATDPDRWDGLSLDNEEILRVAIAEGEASR
jgi:hypothetical protein